MNKYQITYEEEPSVYLCVYSDRNDDLKFCIKRLGCFMSFKGIILFEDLNLLDKYITCHFSAWEQSNRVLMTLKRNNASYIKLDFDPKFCKISDNINLKEILPELFI